MTAVTGLSVLYYKSPPYKKTAPHHRCGLRLSKNLYRYQKWVFSVARSAGFASCKTFGKQPKHPCFERSPKRGEGGSPTFSPFPRGRGLGLGIENKHFFGKTDFFYSLRIIRLDFLFKLWYNSTVSEIEPVIMGVSPVQGSPVNHVRRGTEQH